MTRKVNASAIFERLSRVRNTLVAATSVLESGEDFSTDDKARVTRRAIEECIDASIDLGVFGSVMLYGAVTEEEMQRFLDCVISDFRDSVEAAIAGCRDKKMALIAISNANPGMTTSEVVEEYRRRAVT